MADGCWENVPSYYSVLLLTLQSSQTETCNNELSNIDLLAQRYNLGSVLRPPFDDSRPDIEQVGGGKGLNLTIYFSPRWPGRALCVVPSGPLETDGTLTLPSPGCYLSLSLYPAVRRSTSTTPTLSLDLRTK